MSRHDCRATDCGWRPDATPDVDESRRTGLSPAAQLAAHAIDSGHRLCPVCYLSQSEHDPVMACERCLTRARETLADIARMYAELPRHLGHVPSTCYDQSRPGGGDGRPLLGGDVLVLLGPGSEGLAEDGETTRDGDCTSVAYELGWWEAEWREHRHEPTLVGVRSPAATVRSAVRYLDTRARWAAQSHPGFDEFATDLAEVHLRLERATGRALAPSKAGAACFDCGGALVRRIRTDGFEETHVTCARCRRQYSPAAYLLALAGARREALAGWVTVPAAATAADRPVRTLRTWIEAGVVMAACRVLDRTIMVWYPDIAGRAERAERRATRREQRSA